MFWDSCPAQTRNCRSLSSAISKPVYGPACRTDAVRRTCFLGRALKSFMNFRETMTLSISVVHNEYTESLYYSQVRKQMEIIIEGLAYTFAYPSSRSSKLCLKKWLSDVLPKRPGFWPMRGIWPCCFVGRMTSKHNEVKAVTKMVAKIIDSIFCLPYQ